MGGIKVRMRLTSGALLCVLVVLITPVFVTLMNKYAHDLGMSNTQYINPCSTDVSAAQAVVASSDYYNNYYYGGNKPRVKNSVRK